MVSIRLARSGAKKRPFYHLVAADSRRARDSRYIERLGFYNPIAGENQEAVRIDIQRVDYWLSVGGQLTARAKKVVATQRKLAAAAESEVIAA
jgi:small subunit ribosomal protein S16